ncbi:DUF4245 domain-containing protein [Actinoplanes sp. NEAU-A12]|uniref:DUF4245 domain-containing protein n=1 Tax=Actinoplanes sandaracinus TaxID=3045177 RepID=A0ABT6WJ12_9ACTN|nr:DUF4245 domain-containing protein [Actinoplanes sandaracinus]MDI6099720.1 DUF4245 domain-containing protein [Actinoplanes sandaracinus]
MEPASSPAPVPGETAPTETSATAPSPARAAAATSPRLAAKEGRRPRDMVLSLLVLLVPVALLMTYYKVVLDGEKPHRVKAESLASTLSAAERVFPVAQAAGLSTDWYITSAHFRREEGGSTLRLGYVDPAEKPILMVQSNITATTLVPAEVGAQGERIGAYRTDRRTWMRYTGRPGEMALIVTEQNRTIVIIGNDDDTANLEKLASSLS